MSNLKVQRHFGLNKDPFGKPSGSGEVYKTKTFKDNLDMLESWLREGDMCSVIGNVGDGKTTLLNALVARAERLDNLALVRVDSPDRRELQVSATIYPAFELFCKERRIAVPKIPSSKVRKHYWLKDVLTSALKGQHVAMIVDEAHRLPCEFLKALKELSEIPYGERASVLGILLVGQKTLKNNLKYNVPDVYDRLQVGYKVIEFDRFTIEDVAGYIKFRLHGAGRNQELFSRGAVAAIARASRSYLDINRLAWNGMSNAYRAGAQKVDWTHAMRGLQWQEMFERSGMTQGELAKCSGVSDTVVSAMLKGTYNGDVPANEKKLMAALNDFYGAADKKKTA